MTRLRWLPLLVPLLPLVAQPSREERFRSIPDPARMRSTVERLAARPHHIGSAYGKQNADWIAAEFRSWGFDTHIETFHVLFPTPKERLLQMVVPTTFSARLAEPAIPEDLASAQQEEQLPVYNAYSTDGDVTAPLVYVNYGIPADYETLERLGISVKGCIVIARYGASWRGIKPKLAAEKGAIGCIIYSDPRDDGYFQGEVVPEGPYRNSDGAQRGSVMDMPLHPGDPLTPNIGATKDAKRITKEASGVLTKIPVLPISYGDAQPLLDALEGPVAPDAWRGALPITYRIGPGPANVRLKLSFSWDIIPIHNVIATLRGTEFPDEWIIRGNHHDAWVNGAEDPVSGMAAMMEEARAFGEMVKEGWSPKRTIVYCAWDGEEQGLLGSTEWAEEHADELKKKAVVYINSDGNGRGFLGMAGSHTLEVFINDVARDIVDPETKLSVWKREQLRRVSNARSADDRSEIRNRKDLTIGALGSGSDYTAFLQHLGIASLNLGYGGEDGGGIYHSIYDNVRWYLTYSDSSFAYGRALAQTAGTAVLRLTEAEVLPFEFKSFASTVATYADEVKKLLKTMQDETKERHRQLDDGVYTAIADPREVLIPPQRQEIPPHLNFAPLDNAVTELLTEAEQFAHAFDATKNGSSLSPAKRKELNRVLLSAERELTQPSGLPRRPWFRHLIYAPGFYTGYGVKTLPGVREAIEQRRWKEAETEIVRVAGVMEGFARQLRSARVSLLKR
ncbi:MAG: transferrin receptor-like dimerization domain-containing protein [Bacteroidota bacterium]